MSVILTAGPFDKQAVRTVGSIWRYTFYPHELYLPLAKTDLDRLNTDMPNIIGVPVRPAASDTERIDAALTKCNGEFVTIVPSGFKVGEMWVEDSLYALINSPARQEGFELEGSTDMLWAAVLRKEDLQYARKRFPHLAVRQSLKAAGIALRRLRPEQVPFQFDQLLAQGRRAETDGDCARAAEIFEYTAEHYQNQLWMKALAARAFFRSGNYARADELSSEINRQRPTVDTLLLEAKIKREQRELGAAIELLAKAEQILEGKELVWT
ncbi:MAG: tetratricopeptide repeat protein [Planctomycetota bacterium]|jgi:hypothetical protein